MWISHVGLLRALEAIPAEMRIAVMRLAGTRLEKNRGRRSYLGSTVEYGSDLRLSRHPQLVYNNMVWAPGRVVVGKK